MEPVTCVGLESTLQLTNHVVVMSWLCNVGGKEKWAFVYIKLFFGTEVIISNAFSINFTISLLLAQFTYVVLFIVCSWLMLTGLSDVIGHLQ